MLLGRVLSGTVISQVVLVDAIDHRRIPIRAAEFGEPREQLVLAVEAAIGVVADVIRILEFVRLDVLMPDSELPDKRFRIPFVRFGNRRRVGRDGQRVVAQGLRGGPRQISRIRTARKGHDHAPMPRNESINASCFKASMSTGDVMLPL